jgi:16S rRNA (cytosine967-C5)-methyltransferase
VSSQAIVDLLPVQDVSSVLDYCAGGGGKTLAYAARSLSDVKIEAYDISWVRMNDLDVRAERAGVRVQKLREDPALAGIKYDLVIADVPCSGSGAWRRNPDGKWNISQERLAELGIIQQEILQKLAPTVGQGGVLAYITCSIFKSENEDQTDTFLANNPDWISQKSKRFNLNDGGDGFFVHILARN